MSATLSLKSLKVFPLSPYPPPSGTRSRSEPGQNGPGSSALLHSLPLCVYVYYESDPMNHIDSCCIIRLSWRFCVQKSITRKAENSSLFTLFRQSYTIKL